MRPASALYRWPVAGDLHQAAPVPVLPAATLPNCTRNAPCPDRRRPDRRPPGRSMPTRAGLPICTSARPGTAPPDRPSCGLLAARGHRRHGKPPAGLRRAQRNHASGFAPGFLSPATACPPAPPSLRHCAPHGTPRHQGLAARRWLPCARLRRPRPCERPEQSQSGGPASYITRNYSQPVGCPACARIIFVMQNAGPSLRAPARPGCRAAPARTALLVSGLPACHPSAPEGGSPKVGAGATAICG